MVAVEFEKGPLQRINKILTVAAVIILAMWLWKRFGGAVREESGKAFLSYSGLFSLGVAVVCAGYLLWRFFDWLFWKKYFTDHRR